MSQWFRVFVSFTEDLGLSSSTEVMDHNHLQFQYHLGEPVPSFVLLGDKACTWHIDIHVNEAPIHIKEKKTTRK